MGKILVIDDEESIRFTFRRFLESKGHQVQTASSSREALVVAEEFRPDIVVADIILEDGVGIDILRAIRSRGMICPVIMITGDPNVDTAAEAVRLGAFDYISKPVNEEALLRVAGLALRFKTLHDEKERIQSNLDAIFRSVKDPIITMNLDGVIIEMNDAAIDFFGFSRGSVGAPLKASTGGCLAHCFALLEEVIKTQKRVDANRVECNLEGKPGKIVSLSAFPLLGSKNTFSGVVMIFRDETQLVRLERELSAHNTFHRMVGAHPRMKAVYALIEALSATPSTVMITGESGTGKELVAESIHARSERSQKKFVKVNCAALPEGILEGELFGHVKGAFTGAVGERVGRFQLAHGGTIFLDEIGDLSFKTQGKLLRVLQEREFERLGESSPMKVDVRIIAATNKNLKEKVRTGEFREDLYYRLKVVEIQMPPLRERREDIPLLIEHFLKKFKETFRKPVNGISDEAIKALIAYPWPGNVRELEHAIEHALVLCQQTIITREDLPEEFKRDHVFSQTPFEKRHDDNSRARIVAALEKAGGNKAKAARLLHINRATLYRNMEKLRIADSDGNEEC